MPDIRYRITVKHGAGWPLPTWMWTATQIEPFVTGQEPYMPPVIKGDTFTRKGAIRAAKRAVNKACRIPDTEMFVYRPRQP